MTTNKAKLHTRWMIRRDVPRVADIENDAFWADPPLADYDIESPWDEDDFLAALRVRNIVGMVAEGTRSGRTAGFLVYELHADRVEVRKLVVAPEWRGRGVGAELLAKAFDKVTSHRRGFLTLPLHGGSNWAVKADPAWASEDVRLMCGGDEPPPLWLLADALQEAGCGDEVLLGLFRRGGRMANLVYKAVGPTLASGGQADAKDEEEDD